MHYFHLICYRWMLKHWARLKARTFCNQGQVTDSTIESHSVHVYFLIATIMEWEYRLFCVPLNGENFVFDGWFQRVTTANRSFHPSSAMRSLGIILVHQPSKCAVASTHTERHARALTAQKRISLTRPYLTRPYSVSYARLGGSQCQAGAQILKRRPGASRQRILNR